LLFDRTSLSPWYINPPYYNNYLHSDAMVVYASVIIIMIMTRTEHHGITKPVCTVNIIAFSRLSPHWSPTINLPRVVPLGAMGGTSARGLWEKPHSMVFTMRWYIQCIHTTM